MGGKLRKTKEWSRKGARFLLAAFILRNQIDTRERIVTEESKMRLAAESCSYSKPKGTLTKRVYIHSKEDS